MPPGLSVAVVSATSTMARAGSQVRAPSKSASSGWTQLASATSTPPAITGAMSVSTRTLLRGESGAKLPKWCSVSGATAISAAAGTANATCQRGRPASRGAINASATVAATES
ncbi:MAG TPA: hypothetical protein VFI42_11060 [Thermomicrobiaceae bacterium]|nr:hypothetical protein [Thermomicrobiaceae bacterium]